MYIVKKGYNPIEREKYFEIKNNIKQPNTIWCKTFSEDDANIIAEALNKYYKTNN